MGHDPESPLTEARTKRPEALRVEELDGPRAKPSHDIRMRQRPLRASADAGDRHPWTQTLQPQGIRRGVTAMMRELE